MSEVGKAHGRQVLDFEGSLANLYLMKSVREAFLEGVRTAPKQLYCDSGVSIEKNTLREEVYWVWFGIGILPSSYS